MSLVSVENLEVSFPLGGKFESAVSSVNFEIDQGEIVGLVGESGCGKSVTALALMRLVGEPGRVRAERLDIAGKSMLGVNEDELRKIRGSQVSMIFQEPMTSLNPLFTVGDQIAEVFQIHQSMNRRESHLEAERLLDLVKIPAAKSRARSYPHELSGGMRQRVMIAIALACKPRLLIADEPTTALDVTIQAQILDLMLELQKELKMAILLITHDFGVVAQTCERVLVMYGGKIVEEANCEDIFASPFHPYTKGLLRSIPTLGRKQSRLDSIPGVVPPLGSFPKGCRFVGRCQYEIDQCQKDQPELKLRGERNHLAACWRAEERGG